MLEDAAGRLVGIEVKATATPVSGDLDGLRQFARLVGGRFAGGVLLHTGATSAPSIRRQIMGAASHRLVEPVGGLAARGTLGLLPEAITSR